MPANYLQLNQSKSEVIVFGPPSIRAVVTITPGDLSKRTTASARNPGVTFENISSFHRLRNTATVKSSILTNDLEKRIHSYTSSLVDYL